ncbi:MAG: hypothetical protein SFY70_12440 [Bacteroidia bacterium]|nr:hypothetical protein [Bacteroidia bacterium]
METYLPQDRVLELIRLCWYNGLILNQLQKDPEGTKFLERFRVESLNGIGFDSWNQGSIMMSLYGLFVLPKEYWRLKLRNGQKMLDEEIDKLIFGFLPANFRIDKYFKIVHESSVGDNVQRLRHLRNSIAHGNISLDGNLFVFSSYSQIWDAAQNMYPLRQKMTSDMIRLTSFIQDFGQYFINTLENSASES